MAKDIQYEVGVRFPASAAGMDMVRLQLLSSEFDLSSLVEQVMGKVATFSFYVDDVLSARCLERRLRALRLKRVRVFVEKRSKADWSTAWKEGWKPFALTRKLHVVPLWQTKRRVPKGKEPIFLETTNAFGTGLHETTRFSSQLIEGLRGEFDSFLDVGTGTGILAMVALKCGARHVEAFDIDREAIDVARANLKANGLRCRLFVADAGTYRPERTFDLVAANLVSPDLIAFRDRIASFVAPGGKLVVSGISLKNIPRVKKAFAVPQLKLMKVVRGKEWTAMMFRREGRRS